MSLKIIDSLCIDFKPAINEKNINTNFFAKKNLRQLCFLYVFIFLLKFVKFSSKEISLNQNKIYLFFTKNIKNRTFLEFLLKKMLDKFAFFMFLYFC